MNTRRFPLVVLLLSALTLLGSPAGAQAQSSVALLSSEDAKSVAAGVHQLETGDTELGLALLDALASRKLKVDSNGRLFIERGGAARDPQTGQPLTPAPPARTVPLNNVVRRAIGESRARLELSAEDDAIRLRAARNLAENPDAAIARVLGGLLPTEKNADVRRAMSLAIAKVDLGSDDPQRRIAAARAIADSGDVSVHERLVALSGQNPDGRYTEPDPKVRKAIRDAQQAIGGRLLLIRTVANTLYGLSLGSVLLLAALGLAITFGLMRVINMAHGEMLMVGAYATFTVQNLFAAHLPSLLDWYLLAAVPMAFLATGALGALLERTVIRFLYGRPLETLLATWGLSLILIQAVRSVFGAQNVSVSNPSWLSGGWELMPTLVVPYSRIAVMVFTAVVVAFVWWVLQRTSLGLKVRAVTQNRAMAASLGIATRRVDTWTFALGSGVAGLGGVALSQLGNVGPELGQQHIIDSFMVVVLGGVGNVLGAVFGAMGLGIVNKFLEPSFGAVLGKILILGLVIAFIQWRPQGLFALKGRAQES